LKEGIAEHLQTFHKSFRKGTIKLAQSFLLEEQTAELEKVDEEITEKELTLISSISKSSRTNKERAAVWDVFDDTTLHEKETVQEKSDENTTTTTITKNKPPVDRSTKPKLQDLTISTSPPIQSNSNSSVQPDSPPKSPNEQEQSEEFDANTLVKQLLAGNNIAVEEYLNTLEVEERATIAKEMNTLLKTLL